MDTRSTRVTRWAIKCVIAVLLVGCSTPTGRQVEAVDSSQDTIRFVYEKELHGDDDRDWERGMIECRVEAGSLTNCQRIIPEYR